VVVVVLVVLLLAYEICDAGTHSREQSLDGPLLRVQNNATLRLPVAGRAHDEVVRAEGSGRAHCQRWWRI
jgi:hypothetical protein